MTSQIMTMPEIEKQFDNEWILLEDPVLDEHKQVVGFSRMKRG